MKTQAQLIAAHNAITAKVAFQVFEPTQNGIDELDCVALVEAGLARIERVFVRFNFTTYRLFFL